MGFGPSVHAITHLQKQGLSRHEAIHAVGSVVAEHMLYLMQKTSQIDSQSSALKLNNAIKGITTEVWLKK